MEWWIFSSLALVALVAFYRYVLGRNWPVPRFSLDRGARPLLERALQAIGPNRCVLACELLEHLADRGREAMILECWDRLEIPLLQALPDCPPDLKPRLAEALDACHASCRKRAMQHRLMDMRNALVS